MEKRLFLAIFLSLVVVFGFQTIFQPSKHVDVSKQNTSTLTAIEAQHEKPGVVDFIDDVARQEDRAQIATRDEEIGNDIYTLTVNSQGARVTDVYLKKYKHTFPVDNFASFNAFEKVAFDFKRMDGGIMAMAKHNGLEIVKTITPTHDYFINIDYEIINRSDEIKRVDNKINNISIDMSRVDTKIVQSDAMLYEYSIKTDAKIIRKDNATKFDDKWNKEENIGVVWTAFRDRYFAIIVKQINKQSNFNIKSLGNKRLHLGTTIENIIEPGKAVQFQYKIYLGPQRLSILEKADKEFPLLMVFSNWGWLDAISKGLYWLLGILYNFIPSWGSCIIIISLIVYGLMYPLTAKSLVSMKKLQALQPKMKEIQEKYKNNPERLNKEIVELYRIHQVNPLGGCLPMLLQMPIFVGLYQVLWRSEYFMGQRFLWIKDLSLPDQTISLGQEVFFLGSYINILPILMVGIMFLQQKLNMQSMVATTPEQASQQKMMAVAMPILIGFIFYNMASGLNLYFVIFYLLSTISQWKIATNKT